MYSENLIDEEEPASIKLKLFILSDILNFLSPLQVTAYKNYKLKTKLVIQLGFDIF